MASPKTNTSPLPVWMQQFGNTSTSSSFYEDLHTSCSFIFSREFSEFLWVLLGDFAACATSRGSGDSELFPTRRCPRAVTCPTAAVPFVLGAHVNRRPANVDLWGVSRLASFSVRWGIWSFVEVEGIGFYKKNSFCLKDGVEGCQQGIGPWKKSEAIILQNPETSWNKFQGGIVNKSTNNFLRTDAKAWNCMIKYVHPENVWTRLMGGMFERICQQKARGTNDISILERWLWLFKMMQMRTNMDKCVNTEMITAHHNWAWMNEWMKEGRKEGRKEGMMMWVPIMIIVAGVVVDHAALVCVLAAVVLMLALRYHVAVSWQISDLPQRAAWITTRLGPWLIG